VGGDFLKLELKENRLAPLVHQSDGIIALARFRRGIDAGMFATMLCSNYQISKIEYI
jgi:hypothetical protein